MYHNWLLLLGGVLALLVAIYALRKEVTLRKGGMRTTGVVVDVRQERDEDGVIFHPIVQFTTYDGQEIVWEGMDKGGGWKNAQGKQIQIIYDPQNPRRVIRNHWSGYAWIVLLCFMSAVCMVVFFTGKL